MDELLRELQEKRDSFNIEAEKGRSERDDLNSVARSWVKTRDRFNAELRENLDKANGMKNLREEYNEKVKEGKGVREESSKSVGQLNYQINTFKRRTKGVSLIQLERRLRTLEFKQMTSVLSVDDEKELIKELSNLQTEIKRIEKELLENEEYKKLRDDLVESKKKLEESSRIVEECAEKSQEAHKEMRRLFENCDNARAKADDAQIKFLEVKVKADEAHKRYIDSIKEIRELDKVIVGLLQKDKVAQDQEDEVSAKREAETIFERFKKGEKLSTEDLMTLQKSGYI